MSDVLSSVLVRHFGKNPIVLAWYQSVFAIVIAVILAPFLSLHSTWIPFYVLSGFTSYLAILFFFFVMHRLDVSVVNAGWAFLSCFISLAGFLFLGESWGVYQTAGALLIFVGIFMLSFWHQHISLARTILLLALLGAIYTPIFVIQKAALNAGESFGAAFFWPLIAQHVLSVGGPLFRKSYRDKIFVSDGRTTVSLLFLSFFAFVIGLGGYYFSLLAYSIAPASLVSMTLNTQAFMTIAIAYVFTLILPSLAPRELLTKQSVAIKLGSFFIVFLGLALLSYPV